MEVARILLLWALWFQIWTLNRLSYCESIEQMCCIVKCYLPFLCSLSYKHKQSSKMSFQGCIQCSAKLWRNLEVRKREMSGSITFHYFSQSPGQPLVLEYHRMRVPEQWLSSRTSAQQTIEPFESLQPKTDPASFNWHYWLLHASLKFRNLLQRDMDGIAKSDDSKYCPVPILIAENSQSNKQLEASR